MRDYENYFFTSVKNTVANSFAHIFSTFRITFNNNRKRNHNDWQGVLYKFI